MAKYAEKFIEWLPESFVTAAKMRSDNGEAFILEILVNPDPYEVKKNLPKGARGIITPDGKIYFEAYDDPTLSKVGHGAIQDLLMDRGVLSHNFDYGDANPDWGIPVQRHNNTNNLFIGESAFYGNSVDENVLGFFKKIASKHPYWRFHPTGISDDSYKWQDELTFEDGIEKILPKSKKKIRKKESFYGAEKEKSKGRIVEVYLNPNEMEISQHIVDGARGYIDKEGNLYMEGYDKRGSASIAIHNVLLSIIYAVDSQIFPYTYINEFNEKLSPLHYGITVQRVGKTNKILLGESEHVRDNENERIEEIKMLFQKCQKKNPFWVFDTERIVDVEGYLDFDSNEIGYKDLENYEETIYGHIANVYHRTGKLTDKEKEDKSIRPTIQQRLARSAKKIITQGYYIDYNAPYKPSGGLYGNGLYANYELEAALKPGASGRIKAEKYGDFLLEMKVDISRFLILEEPAATMIHGKNHKLRDQLEMFGFFKYIKPDAKYIESLFNKEEKTYDIDDVNQILKDFGYIMIVPTVDYQLNKKAIRITKQDKVTSEEGRFIVMRHGNVFIDFPNDKIDDILYVTKETDEKINNMYHTLINLCDRHENGEKPTSEIGTPMAHMFYKNRMVHLWYNLIEGLIYTGANDYQSLAIWHPERTAIPYRIAFAPARVKVEGKWESTHLHPEMLLWKKLSRDYINRWLGVIKRKEPESKYPIGRQQESFRFQDVPPDKQQKLYDIFKHSYEKATGSSWSQDRFTRKAYTWLFFGDENGGVAIREQKSGLNKFVAAFGSPKSVVSGFKELLATKGKEPIWGGMDDKLASHLESFGFTRPPKIIMKTLVKLIAPTLGDEVEGVAPDGGLIIRLKHSGETMVKYVLGNKAYYRWLIKKVVSGIPSMVLKWVSLIGKRRV